MIATFAGDASTVYSLIELGNGHIASGHGDGKIRIWNKRTRECIGEWE